MGYCLGSITCHPCGSRQETQLSEPQIHTLSTSGGGIEIYSSTGARKVPFHFLQPQFLSHCLNHRRLSLFSCLLKESGAAEVSYFLLLFEASLAGRLLSIGPWAFARKSFASLPWPSDFTLHTAGSKVRLTGGKERRYPDHSFV